MSDVVTLWVVVITLVGLAGYLIWMQVKSVLDERRSSRVRRIWRNFALGIVFAVLFLVSWIVQGIAEWSVYREEQRSHGEPAVVSEYIVTFGQSTLENWQSEFLQLFSFVVLSAVFIHRGSAESKDGTERIERTVNEIRRMLVEREGTSAETSASAKR